MRLKGLLFTSCLAAMLGVGAFAGLSSFKSSEPAQKAEAAASTVTNGNKRINVFKYTDDNNWIFDDQAKIAIRYGLSNSVGSFNFSADSNIGTASKDSQGMRTLGYQINSKDVYFATKELGKDFTTTWTGAAVCRHDKDASTFTNDNCWNVQELNDNTNTWISRANTFYYNGNKIEAFGYYYKVALHTGINLEKVSYDLRYATNFLPDNPSAISGHIFEGWYTDPSFSSQTKFNRSDLTGDINLYAHYLPVTSKDVYVDAYGWGDVYVYSFETINGVKVEHNGSFPGERVGLNDYNLRFNNGQLQKVPVKYAVSSNVKFIVSDGSNNPLNKSADLSLTEGAYYWYHDSNWSGETGDRALAAAFVYDLNEERLKVSASGSIKEYSICGLDAKTWVDRYNGLNATARGYINSASMFTYKDRNSSGADTTVTFAEVIGTLRERYNVTNGQRLEVAPNSESTAGVVAATALVSVASVAAVGGFIFIRKKKII